MIKMIKSLKYLISASLNGKEGLINRKGPAINPHFWFKAQVSHENTHSQLQSRKNQKKTFPLMSATPMLIPNFPHSTPFSSAPSRSRKKRIPASTLEIPYPSPTSANSRHPRQLEWEGKDKIFSRDVDVKAVILNLSITEVGRAGSYYYYYER